jgi:microcystin degradation protein MlrC
MRIAVASIIQENNTFSPVKTRYENFSPVFGDEAVQLHDGRETELGGFIHTLRKARCKIEPVCAAWAITAGPMMRSEFKKLVQAFQSKLRSIGRVDAFLFALHGAQTAQGVDDAAGYLIRTARGVLGPITPIVITLDLHANVTRLIVSQSTAVVGYRTYPHVDMFECGRSAAAIVLKILAGKIKPAVGFQKIPMIVPAENMQTMHGPFHALMVRAREWERANKVISASVFGVQPWLDVKEMGCSVVVVTNDDFWTAQERAGNLAREFWSSRRDFAPKLTRVGDAIRRARAIPGGPIVFSESSDSTGSGSPGDSTNVMTELLKANFSEPCAVFLVDPQAVRNAIKAGVGNSFTGEIGARFDRRNSRPVSVTAHVRLLSDGRWTPWGRGYNPGIEISMGRSAVLEIGSVKVLASERPAMTVDPALFRSHGIEPTRMKIVVVKSPNGFRAEYEPIAKAIFVLDTPGVSSANLRSLPFKNIPRPMYPLDDLRSFRLSRA